MLAIRKGRDGDLLAVACSRLVTKGGIGKATITESDIELYAGWSWTVDPDGASCLEQRDLVATLARRGRTRPRHRARRGVPRPEPHDGAVRRAGVQRGGPDARGLGDVRSLRKLY